MPTYKKDTQALLPLGDAPATELVVEVAPGLVKEVPSLRAKFGVPPFSVLSVQSDYWRESNRQWTKEIGLRGCAAWGIETEMPMLDFPLDELPEGPGNKALPREIVGALFALIRQNKQAARNSTPSEFRFGLLPLSILSARGGFWQTYKRHWIHNIGLHGERGRSEIETTDGNTERVLGVGLSEGQARINASMEKYDAQKRRPDAVPGGGPKSVRRRAPKDLGKCFGSGNPGDLSAGFRDAESPKQPGDFIGAKVRDFDYYRRVEGTRPPLMPEEESK